LDSFCVLAKNLKVGKQTGKLTITEMRPEMEEDNDDDEDEEHNYDAIKEQEAEHESESENKSDTPFEEQNKDRG
jgi:hypothetical protein